MINLKTNTPSKGMKESFTIESDEKVTVSFMTTEKGDTLAFIYRGTGDDINEYTEPIKVYSSRNKNLNWSVKQNENV